ncbi:acylphosphatase-2 isoform X1 [Lissotriton helveticus]
MTPIGAQEQLLETISRSRLTPGEIHKLKHLQLKYPPERALPGYTEDEARKLGVVGWVKNTRQGTVIGQVQGPEDEVETISLSQEHNKCAISSIALPHRRQRMPTLFFSQCGRWVMQGRPGCGRWGAQVPELTGPSSRKRKTSPNLSSKASAPDTERKGPQHNERMPHLCVALLYQALSNSIVKQRPSTVTGKPQHYVLVLLNMKGLIPILPNYSAVIPQGK